jgi:dTDP-6-deoxy-L-talose 4-dehydrogenase (NAD+)
VKILLTGATGFIGSAFLRRALSNGHSVAALVRAESLALLPFEHKNLKAVKGTVSNTPWDEIKTFQPETCVHCAWTTAPKVAYDSAEHLRFFEQSRAFLDRLFDLGVSQVIGLGTCIEYVIGNTPLVEEQTPIGPVGPYAESKNMMRVWLEEASAHRGFQLCWPRVFYVYGVGEDPTRLCTSLIQRFRRNEPIVLKTPRSTKDYIYIEDVVSALILLLEKQFQGVVNLGTGVGVTIFELAQTVAALLGKRGLVQTEATEGTDPLGFVVADSTRLRSLGWQPQFNLETGLKNLIEAIS